LGALLGEYLEPEVEPSDVRTLPLTSIVPNPTDLTSSIRENGLLQPLVVRPAPGSADRYELVAGERRFRALTKLEWAEAPVVVRDADDETLLVLALVENLQREALNPIEEAEGYQALSERFGMKTGRPLLTCCGSCSYRSLFERWSKKGSLHRDMHGHCCPSKTM
jgi:ParB family chromosome partitioning protein